ncbi:galactose-binding domain-containing protein [Aquimarina agarilytica]|uniref:galactose-binding domain-containing protein n=1 Tax=Aquimarina agarilytica TaxID=1087449 RepID=UPI000289A132|nr:carbohydrate-binding protein [Aquimarina agarilytica]
MNYLKKGIAAAILLSSAYTAYAQPAPPQGKRWEVVPEMTDEFNNGFDTVKWRKELWQYPNTPTLMVAENSGVSNGNLWIKATEGPNPTYFHSSRIYSNAQIKYPMYTESRIITAHLSAYNTFWLNNGDINDRDEIDVIENNSRPSCGCQPNFPWQMNSQYFQATNGFTVRNADNFDNRNLSANNPKRGVRWNEEYHTVGVWWKDAKNMTFYLDGEEAGSVVVGQDRGGRNYPEIRFSRELNLVWDLWTADENFLGGAAVRAHLRDDSINTMRVDWVHTFTLVDGQGGPGPIDPIDPIDPVPGNNIALNKPATQSSNYLNRFPASLAVDGNTNGADNFNHTENDQNAWLEVDLGSVSDITTINVYNRTDCCQGRLNNFHVLVSDTPFTSKNLNTTINQSGVGNFFTSGNGGSPTTIQANRTGRYVRVQLAGSNFLHVKELIVNGTEGSGGGGTPPNTGNATIVIEAENFNNTGGTFNDAFAGGPGLGVNVAGNNINYVNSGDFTAHTINVQQAGVYTIEYLISTPSDNAQIQLSVDGNVVSTDNVPNNGQWNSFSPLVASSTVNLSAGTHDIVILASGSNVWQWNLDKVTLRTGLGAKIISSSDELASVNVYPNPVADQLNFVAVDGFDSAIIYDLNGRVVNEVNLKSTTNVNIESLSNGIYMVKIIGNGTQKVQRIVVTH